MTDDPRRPRLIDKGAETLADALLQLAVTDDLAEQLVHRLTATPEEQIKRIKARIAGLKRAKRFIDWRGVREFARDLEALVEDIAAVEDPKAGLELAAAFFETDRSVFDRCDDSSGYVGDIYRITAAEVFADFAARWEDKDKLVKRILKLLKQDDYGVRDHVVYLALGYLPETHIRKLIAAFQQRAQEQQGEEFARRYPLMLVESLARQIGDAALFEKTRIDAWGEPGTGACTDIARVWLGCGEPEKARDWLRRIEPGVSFMAEERDDIWIGIWEALGEAENLAEVAWRIFRRHRSAASLETLLGRIGEEQRQAVITQEAERILADADFHIYDTSFLLDIGEPQLAEQYLLARREKINGDYYDPLISLAGKFEALGYVLTTSVLYRALLDSILNRGRSASYSHGVRYLRKLDKLAPDVEDWPGMVSHELYHKQLRQFHGRKKAFWGRYDG